MKHSVGVISTTGKALVPFLDVHPAIGPNDPALYDILDAPTFLAAGATTKYAGQIMDKLFIVTDRLLSLKDDK